MMTTNTWNGTCTSTNTWSINAHEQYYINLEFAADLLATGTISSLDYFRAKEMLKSTDLDIVRLGRTFLETKSEML